MTKAFWNLTYVRLRSIEPWSWDSCYDRSLVFVGLWCEWKILIVIGSEQGPIKWNSAIKCISPERKLLKTVSIYRGLPKVARGFSNRTENHPEISNKLKRPFSLLFFVFLIIIIIIFSFLRPMRCNYWMPSFTWMGGSTRAFKSSCMFKLNVATWDIHSKIICTIFLVTYDTQVEIFRSIYNGFQPKLFLSCQAVQIFKTMVMTVNLFQKLNSYVVVIFDPFCIIFF